MQNKSNVMETNESNKAIALFMGWKEEEIQCEDWCGCNVLDTVFEGLNEMRSYRPDESWNDLIPAVKKIMNTEFVEDSYEYQVIDTLRIYSDIKAVYAAVVAFITWYNTQNK